MSGLVEPAVRNTLADWALTVDGSKGALTVRTIVLCCKTALMGASLSVLINVRLMKDSTYADALKAETDALLEKYCPLSDKVYAQVLEKLS